MPSSKRRARHDGRPSSRAASHNVDKQWQQSHAALIPRATKGARKTGVDKAAQSVAAADPDENEDA
jgi:hypothetical protein